ncbi:MAG: gliding motility-associated C-terminal domain-containing protein [Bacteroidota bacterium]
MMEGLYVVLVWLMLLFMGLLLPGVSYAQTVEKQKPPMLFMPTAFTPYGDNLNDLYVIYAHGIQRVAFSVYDRYHTQHYVFEGPPDRLAWDGNNANGYHCPEGVYVYIIRAYPTDDSLEPIDRSGTITLVR